MSPSLPPTANSDTFPATFPTTFSATFSGSGGGPTARLAIFSAWLFLEANDRTSAGDAAYRMISEHFGGFPGLVAFWANHPGVPARLAAAISSLTHLRAVLPDPETEALHAQATSALWVDGDLEATESLLTELASSLADRRSSSVTTSLD